MGLNELESLIPIDPFIKLELIMYNKGPVDKVARRSFLW